MVREREAALSDLRKIQVENRPLHEQQIREQRSGSRIAPLRTAPAEVTVQFDGWLRGEAGRHNNAIDQKLDDYEAIHGKEFDRERFARDELYRRVVLEEDRARGIREPVITLRTNSSLEAPSVEQQSHTSVALDPTDGNRNLAVERERVGEHPLDLNTAPGVAATAKQEQTLDSPDVLRPISEKRIEKNTPDFIRRPAAEETPDRHDGVRRSDVRQNSEAAAGQNTTAASDAQRAQSQKQEEKVDWARYERDPGYRLELKERREELRREWQQQQKVTTQRQRRR
jgi:hypothetical protein